MPVVAAAPGQTRPVTTFSERRSRPAPAGVLRVAVKDLIDEAGHVTTAGCRALADRATPASVDAACVAGVRAAERHGRVAVVGRTVLHELAYGITGVNEWAGTPRNPLDPRLVPGGSSSGSAAAVAAGEADVALGTDTGGSIRIPATCCGVAGLKTTHGRVPLLGVRPLAPSMDTVGLLSRDVAGLIAGMGLLEPGFIVPGALPVLDRPWRVGRLQLPAHPAVDRAVDDAVAVLADAHGLEVVPIEPERDLPGWARVQAPSGRLLSAEAWASAGLLVRLAPDHVGDDVRGRLLAGSAVTAGQRQADQRAVDDWRAELGRLLARVDVLALPTLTGPVPRLDDADAMYGVRQTLPVNAAGVPALSLPLISPVGPVGLQLVGPPRSEPLLLRLAAPLDGRAAVS